MTRENRRFPRYVAAISVSARRKNIYDALTTADVSRHGAFVLTDAPRGERELVQLIFRTPHGDVEAMCMVARAFRPGDGRAPGMGVDFFALSKEAKNVWEAFIHDLKVRGTPCSRATPRAASRA